MQGASGQADVMETWWREVGDAADVGWRGRGSRELLLLGGGLRVERWRKLRLENTLTEAYQ